MLDPKTLRLFAMIPFISGLVLFLTGLVAALGSLGPRYDEGVFGLVLGSVLIVAAAVIFIRSYVPKNGLMIVLRDREEADRATEMRRETPPGLG